MMFRVITHYYLFNGIIQGDLMNFLYNNNGAEAPLILLLINIYNVL